MGEKIFNSGKFDDERSGLYYFNARWYDPGIGRFVSEDPIWDGDNWYGYCANNPLRFVDPTGLSKEDNAVYTREYINEEVDTYKLEGEDWGIIATGDYSKTGGVDLNLSFLGLSFSIGPNGLQIEVGSINNKLSDLLMLTGIGPLIGYYGVISPSGSAGMAITWGGPEEERGVNFNISTLTSDTNIGVTANGVYGSSEILTFGVEWALGNTSGIGAYSFFGEEYYGTDAEISYNCIDGGNYYDKATGETTPIDGGFVFRLGGKYVGPGWTTNGWGTSNHYYDSWGNWSVAYSMFDHAARIHDKRSNWDYGNAEKNAADWELVGNSVKAFLFSTHSSDNLRSVFSMIYFSDSALKRGE